MSNNTISVSRLQEKTAEIKRNVLKMCVDAGTGHVSSSFSIAEILVTLYHGGVLNVANRDPEWNSRDRFILSKGQASPILYAVLADCGFFPTDWCATFNKPGGKFAVHLQNTVPGVELSTGSLGLGLGVGCGMAYGLKLYRKLPLVWVLLGDAECYEGSIWESALFAAHNHLNNLVVIIDRNCLGATDFTENMCGLENLAAKWKAFGWDVHRIPGHDIGVLLDSFSAMRRRSTRNPTVFICDTTKGNGLDYMNDPLWHSRTPSGELAKQAMEELS